MKLNPNYYKRELFVFMAITVNVIAYGMSYPQDSLYRQAITEGSSKLNCYFTYPQGKSEISASYATNYFDLYRLDAFINRIFSDPSVYVDQIVLTGYSSIEGGYNLNKNLSMRRVENIKNYLELKYRLLSRCIIQTQSVAEDWRTLRQLVESSGMSEKYEILQIIDLVPDPDQKEALLKRLNGGQVYNILKREYFPLLRRVELTIHYDIKKTLEKRFNRMLSDSELENLVQRERQAILQNERESQQSISNKNNILETNTPKLSTEPGSRTVDTQVTNMKKPPVKPLLSIKTNLVSLVGITPKFKHKTFMPNIQAEYFFADRWSIEGTATYAYWNYDNDKQFWGVSGYGAEPRFWLLSKDGNYKWVYIGAFGIAGDFDIQTTDLKDENLSSEGIANYTGTYWQAGLSVGCYIPLTRHLGLELGVKGGYMDADRKVYVVESDRNIWEKNAPKSEFGLMGVNVSLSWRFGK